MPLNDSMARKKEPPDSLAVDAGAIPPPYSAPGSGLIVSTSTTTTTTKKRTVKRKRMRRRIVKSTSTTEEQLESEEAVESEEETVTSHHSSAAAGLGAIGSQSVHAPAPVSTPTILVDKPLPDFPSPRSKRRSATPPPRLRAGISGGEGEGSNDAQISRSASVRRIKSYGDVISATKQQGRRSYYDQNGALPPLPLDEKAKLAIYSQPIVPDALGAPPSRPKVLTKRASSLGFGRRPSTSNLLQAAASSTTPVTNGTIEDDVSVSPQKRTASSATAPAGPADRKRKGSGFSFVPSFLRSKPRDTSSSTVSQVPENTASTEKAEIMVSEPDDILTPPSTSSGLGLSTPVPTPLATPTSSSSSRRYSIFPSFFRSASSTPTGTTPAVSTPTPAITPPLVSPTPQPLEPPQLLTTHIDIVGKEDTLPQLPSIERNLAEMSFSTLFDFNGAGGSRKGKRSRASTKSSVNSFISSSSQPSSSGLRRSPSNTSQQESQDYLNCRRRSIVTSSLQPGESTPSGLERSRTITKATGSSDPPTLQAVPPRSPAIDIIASRDSGKIRNRIFRSNSASSVVPTRLTLSGTSPVGSSSLTSRPSFLRSRSSSTATTHSQTRTLHVNASNPALHSPAITVTPHPPYFDGLPRNSNGTFDAMSSSPIASEEALPPLSVYSSSTSPSTPDVNIEDALSDFMPPPSAPAIRFSTDSQGSSAHSLVSSSPSSTSGRPSSIIQSRFRRRANTAGSLLSSSVPPSATGSAPTQAGVNAIGILATRPARSNSSSRLSSFFTSPGSFLSSSPTASATSPSWFSARETASGGTGLTSSTANSSTKETFKSPSSSYFGSPNLSAGTADPWSSTSSLPNSSPQTSTTNLPTTAITEFGQRGTASPALSQSSSSFAASASTRLRSGSILSKSRLSTNIEEDDTPESYVERLKEAVNRSEMATLLASVGDAFHLAALKVYLTEFEFTNEPIDIALRKLLLNLHLPRETQQIDRVMEAFAERYNLCNPALFTTPDQPYILAFSMIMLHTDAFNKAAKTKMTKADYVKNTRIDGISPDLLEYIYDNIVYAPFIYAADNDDGADSFAQRSLSEASVAMGGGAGSSGGGKGKIDVYGLITSKQTSKLRVDVQMQVPVKNPFSYTGTVAFFDCSALHNAFAYAHVLEIPSPARRTSDPNNALAGPTDLSQSVNMKVTKVGVLERKDDLLEGGRKASSRKWKPWSVLLTGSQILLFKDTYVASAMEEQIYEKAGTSAPPQKESQRVYLPPLTSFKPDFILSLYDTVALYDFTYSKYTNVFRLLQPNGRQMLFKAEDEASLNSWMSTINYGASFRTAGIRMRNVNPPPATSPSVGLLPALPQRAEATPADLLKASTATSISAASIAGSSQPEAIDEGEEGSSNLPRDLREYVDETFVFTHSTTSDLRHNNDMNGRRHNSRGDIVRSKVIDLEAKIKVEQAALAADLRIVRNLAILVPFTVASRAKIQQGTQPVARRIRTTRQNIAKLICCRECLCRDLLASEREVTREKQHLATSTNGTNTQIAEAKRTDLKRATTDTSSTAHLSNGLLLRSALAKSASQDDLARIGRTPSLLRRSLTSTSDTEQVSQAPGTETPGRMLDGSIQDTAPLPLPRLSMEYSSSPSRHGYSPVLAASPFEPVQEEEPGQIEYSLEGQEITPAVQKNGIDHVAGMTVSV